MPSRPKPVPQSVTIADRELKAAYQRFMREPDRARKEEAGKDLIRAIFGNDAVAGDTLL